MVSDEKKYVRIPKLLLAILLIVVVLIIIGLIIGLIVLGVKNSELSTTATKEIITTIASTHEISTTPTKIVTTTSSIEPSKITTTTKLATVPNKCKNFGKWDENKKKCSCFPSTNGDYCENEIECSKLVKDPEECKLTNENSPSLDYLKVYCPLKYRCQV